LRLSKSGMNRFILKGLLILSLLTPVAVACTEGSCFDETESYLKATLYTTLKEKTVAAAPETLSLTGAGQDSIIYDKKTGLKVALFPLNSSSQSSRFIISINNIVDTIEFWYSSYPHLISKECGYTYYHNLDSVHTTDHNINTIEIKNHTITNLNVENIRLYY
jgi:hypothetical protein